MPVGSYIALHPNKAQEIKVDERKPVRVVGFKVEKVTTASQSKASNVWI
jgi:hypothetical protein